MLLKGDMTGQVTSDRKDSDLIEPLVHMAAAIWRRNGIEQNLGTMMEHTMKERERPPKIF